MNPLNTDLPLVYLKPGEVHFSEQPELVVTILGSCISLVMFHPRFKLAAVSHSLLPRAHRAGDDAPPHKFIDTSFQEMTAWFYRHGVKAADIRVKIFGGGDVIQYTRQNTSPPHKTVGTQNIEQVLRLVLEKGLKIAAIDVGGNSGRKLFIYTHTGEVFLKKIKRTEIDRHCFQFEQQVK